MGGAQLFIRHLGGTALGFESLQRTNCALAKFFGVAHMRGAPGADAREKVEQRRSRSGHG